MPRGRPKKAARDLSAPDVARSPAWMAAHVVLTAAVAWLDALSDDDPTAMDIAVGALERAVRNWLAVREEPGASLPPPRTSLESRQRSHRWLRGEG